MKKFEIKTIFCSEMDKRGNRVVKICAYSMPFTALCKKNNFLVAEFKEVKEEIKCTSITISNATRDLVKDWNSKGELSISLTAKEDDGTVINKIIDHMKKTFIGMGITKEQAIAMIKQAANMTAESSTKQRREMLK